MSVEKMTYCVHQLLHNDIFRTIVVVRFQEVFRLIFVCFFLIFKICIVLSYKYAQK